MLKKLLIVLALLLVAAVGVIIYLWMQVTALPEWYDPEAPEAVAQEGRRTAGSRSRARATARSSCAAFTRRRRS